MGPQAKTARQESLNPWTSVSAFSLLRLIKGRLIVDTDRNVIASLLLLAAVVSASVGCGPSESKVILHPQSVDKGAEANDVPIEPGT